MSSTADVVVVGAGVVGASVAFHLALRGVRNIVVCERRWPAAGATGKSGALVRTHYTNVPEARLAAASLPYFHHWSDLVGRGDCGFLRCGMVRIVAPAAESRLRANMEMLERLGVNTRILARAELAELVPGWNLDDVPFAAWEPESGCADPVGTTHGFLARAREVGAQVRLRTEVSGVEVNSGRVSQVQTRPDQSLLEIFTGDGSRDRAHPGRVDRRWSGTLDRPATLQDAALCRRRADRG
jgi:sarcosine oxidase subunit beta